MNPNKLHSNIAARRAGARLLSGSLCALALAFAGGTQAMGDPVVAEMPGVRPGAAVATSPLSRADVREALRSARAAGLLPVVGDTGGGVDLQAQRDLLIAGQTDAMQIAVKRTRRVTAETAMAKELQAYVELRATGAHPAMLRPSSDGKTFIDAEGRETLVVEIDD